MTNDTLAFLKDTIAQFDERLARLRELHDDRNIAGLAVFRFPSGLCVKLRQDGTPAPARVEFASMHTAIVA